MPKSPVRGRRVELSVDHLEAVDDHPIVGRLNPKAYQFEEAGVNHRALVDADRIAHFVQLQAAPNRRAVDLGVLRE